MNCQRSFLIALICVLLAPTYGRAQAWSGILDPTRAIDWSGAGAGAIPARTTICSTLGTAGQAASFVQSVTVANINSALSSCTSGQTVLLNPGTYNTNAGTILIPSNVTLRGSGPTRTIIAETGAIPTTGNGIPVVAFGTTNSWPFGTETNSGTSTAITGGTAQGSISITVASASGISVGKLLTLTQTNLSYMTINGDEGACTYCSGNEPENDTSGQTVLVTGVSGNTITISDPLYIAYTSSPLAFPFNVGATSAGLENLQIYASNSVVTNNSGGGGYVSNIMMVGTTYCWVKNVESNFTEGDHVHVLYGMHNTIRDSFFHDAFSHGSGTTDAMLLLGTKASANLVENNIFWRLHESILPQWGASGNVIAYNYSSGNYNSPAPNSAQQFDIDAHGPNPMMNLFEGNIITHYRMDSIHGSSNYFTVFRSYSTGANLSVLPDSARGALQLPGSPENTEAWAYEINDLSRYNNLVGIIDGSDYLVGQPAASRLVYPQTITNFNPACFSIASNGGGGGGNTLTDSTMLYQGVMDCNTGTFQWQNGVQTLPASFYLSSKPSWWGAGAWPPIGPDVTGGNFTDWVNSTATTARGHVYKIPAVNCFNSSTSNGTNNITTFDANICYTSTGGTGAIPAPPAGLSAVVQ